MSLVVGLALAALVGRGALSARDSSPAATPDIPLGTECTVEALGPGDLIGIVSSGSASDDLLTRSPVDEATLPTGPAASDAEVAGITATTRQLVACANARDPFRIIALLSPDFQAALAGAALGLQAEIDQGTAAADAQATLEERFPVPVNVEDIDGAQELAMIPIREARLLTDGRVGAILEPTVEGVDATVGFFVTFELVGETWLIDDVEVLAAGPQGTPAASPPA